MSVEEVRKNTEANKNNLHVYGKLDIKEVSLVSDPCCPSAEVVIMKSKDGLDNEGNAFHDNNQLIDGWLEDFRKTTLATEPNFQSVQKVRLLGEEILARIDDLDIDDVGEVKKVKIQEVIMDMKEMENALATADAALSEANAEIAKSKASETVLTERVAALEAEIAKSKPPAGDAAGEENLDEIFKGLPESIRKAVERDRAASAAKVAEADAIVKKAKADEEAATKETIVAKAKAFGAKDVDTLAGVLADIHKSNPKHADILIENFAHIGKVADESIFKAAGVALAQDASEPKEIMKAKVADIKKAKPDLTDAQAYDEALVQNPELYEKLK